MSDKANTGNPASRIIRERAMAVLRDTRARIDPKLLAAMRDHLAAASAVTKEQAQEALKPEIRTEPEEEPLILQNFADPPGTEPVDRQKIAQIVLHYMKNREDKQKH